MQEIFMARNLYLSHLKKGVLAKLKMAHSWGIEGTL